MKASSSAPDLRRGESDVRVGNGFAFPVFRFEEAAAANCARRRLKKMKATNARSISPPTAAPTVPIESPPAAALTPPAAGADIAPTDGFETTAVSEVAEPAVRARPAARTAAARDVALSLSSAADVAFVSSIERAEEGIVPWIAAAAADAADETLSATAATAAAVALPAVLAAASAAAATAAALPYALAGIATVEVTDCT